jgi:hypothetical protein
VADLCVLTASGFLSAYETFVLEMAAMLHDIGKIGVPDAVLLKPGPLTDEEWHVMRTHDRIGVEIINSAFRSAELTRIVQTHHAFFGGVVEGLPSGHDIPLRARILSIADAYDAMVTDRVYRKRRPQEAAFEELRRCAGTQFDPELVERFIEAVSARDARREPAPPAENTEVLIQLGLAVERLAAAVEANDFEGLAAMADRLRSVATACNQPRIAELAVLLGSDAEAERDLSRIVGTTKDLLGLCESAQHDLLETRPQLSDTGAKGARAA